MLLILIPIAWFTLAVLVVLLCRMAARGDDALAHTSEQLAPLPRVTLTPRARWQETPHVGGSRTALAWRAPRSRQGRCVTGS